MNTVTTKEGKQIVSLEELVPQHDCLKLLILHTPYTLLIDTLPLCTNLVKLDLSKNNLETFPHLGSLTALRFMFLHENRLDLSHLKNIFEQHGQPSQLSLNIVWVTFWGNRSPFLARHYLVNSTNAIAVDKNMIVPEERSPCFPNFTTPEAFSPQTDISNFLRRKTNISRYASEEEYMNQLWQQLKQLRKKHESLFPVIKIQKVFRGWFLRETYRRNNQQLEEQYQIQDQFFLEWKQYTEKRLKLQKYLTERGKSYLLSEGRQAKRRELMFKVLAWAKRAKARVAARNKTLVYEYRFYKSIKNNFDQLKNLYNLLQLQSSSSLFISRNSWNLFEQFIVPFVSNFTKEPIVPKPNQEYAMHCLYDHFAQNTRETLKIYQTNIKSKIFNIKNLKKIDLRQQRRGIKNLTFDIKLKSIYRPCHFSNDKMREVQDKIKYIQSKDKYSKEQLVKIQGDLRLLKDIVRGIYFYNSKCLKIINQGDQRIYFLSEISLKRISSAVKIQKVWRGFIFRKKNDHYLRAILKMQRAATIIQRWFRRLPTQRRRDFIFGMSKQISAIQDSCLYIDCNDYINFVGLKTVDEGSQIKPSFLEQYSKIYIDRSNKLIGFGWNTKDTVQIEDNILYRKIPFSSIFFIEIIGLTPYQLHAKIIFDSSRYEEAEPGHLFHFQTQTSLVKKQGKKYVQIKCTNKSEAKFRFLLLKLLTCSFKDSQGITILCRQDVCNPESVQGIDPAFSQTSFVCNQNLQMLSICQKGLMNNPSKMLSVVSNKFYFPKNDRKPIKTEQKLYVFTTSFVEKEIKIKVERHHTEGALERRYKTEISYAEEMNSHFLVDLKDNEIQSVDVSLPQEKLKRVIAKRSMKQFKIDKRLKQRKPQQPSFILDSISINDRLTTQPQAFATQPSVREPHLQENLINSKGNVLSNHKALSADIQKTVSQDRKKMKSNYTLQRAQSLKRQEEDTFVRKFVNMGNFIQNQFANDYRRRLKIQSEHSVLQSAQNVKRSMQRSHSQRVAKIQQKLKDVREKHSQHRDLITKNEQSSKEQVDRLKSQVNQQRQKRVKQKSRLRRLKVSFAEECYPLGTRDKSSQHFS